MIVKIFLPLLLLFLSACDKPQSTKELDGKALLEQKCASCHDLSVPPLLREKEVAPPMMAVAFHVYDFIEASDESQKLYKAIDFVVDYVKEPSLEKAFCDKESLKKYGLMPSLKISVSDDESRAIAKYMFSHFTPKKLSESMEAKAKYDALPEGEKIALKYNCMGCHKKEKDLVGPSLKKIQEKFAANKEAMKQSIQNGSQGKWEKRAAMPSFKQIEAKELETLAEWIVTLP